MSDEKRTFVCYLDDNDKKVSGYFQLMDKSKQYIKILSGKNTLTLPWNRILKVKENDQ